jgi:uncharacterized protein YijF (DUF1287 family)
MIYRAPHIKLVNYIKSALIAVMIASVVAPNALAGALPQSVKTNMQSAVTQQIVQSSGEFSTMATAIVLAARNRTFVDIRYDPKYVRLSYPGGDVPADTGVCTDVVIRTYRTAFGFDFQKAIHEDMKINFEAYPKAWGLSRPDKNIDHRRVPNIETFLRRKGASIKITKNADDYQPGDLVTWRLGGRLPHIGIVSDKKSTSGTPLIIHNVGSGPVEDNLLFKAKISGHFRYQPSANSQNA